MTNFAFIQGIGPLELIIVLGVVLVIFGPKRLPGLGRSVGTGLKELKASLAGKDAPADDADASSAPDTTARAQTALGRPLEPLATDPAPTPAHEPDRVPERR